jgi:hypothetical protein
MRAATTTQESELARLRSEALVSQQTLDTLHRQMPTTMATHGARTQEQQRGMQPPVHLPNYSLASMGTPFRGRTDNPISGYDSRPPNYSYLGSLPILKSQTHFVLCMATKGDVKDPPINLLRARHQHMLMDEALIDFRRESIRASV